MREGEDNDTLENKFIDGEFEAGDASPFVDDDDRDTFVDEDGDELPGDDEEDQEFRDDDDEDDNYDDDDEDEKDEDDAKEGASDDGVDGDAGKDDADADGDSNEFYLRGQHWKESGRLAADVEIPKNVSQLELEDLYAKQVAKNVEARFQAKYADLIEAKGINPDDIFGEQASYDELALNQCRFVANLTYDALLEKSKDVTADIKAIGQTYHLSRNENLTEKEVEGLLKIDLDDHSEEELFEKYQTYFTTEAKNLETKIQTNKVAAAKEATEKATRDAAYIKQKLSAMGLTEDKAKIVFDGMTLRNHVYDNGKGYRKPGITLLEKIRLESANSLDQQLEMAVNLILKPDPQTAKEKQERVGTLTTLQKLAKVNGGEIRSQNNKTTTNKRQTVVPKTHFLND